MIQCILYDTVYPYASIPHPIRSTSSVEFYLRYDLTADYRTSPVPAISHFYLPFFLHSISFHNLMFERFIIQCILYDTSHKSLEHTTLIYIISGFKLSFLHTILFYIRRSLICNCTHSSILPALHPSYFPHFIPRTSVPFYHTSRTQSVLHPRSYSTFGTILPPIIEQVLCPRSPLLFTFLLLYNLMFERFMRCILYDAMYPL